MSKAAAMASGRRSDAGKARRDPPDQATRARAPQMASRTRVAQVKRSPAAVPWQLQGILRPCRRVIAPVPAKTVSRASVATVVAGRAIPMRMPTCRGPEGCRPPRGYFVCGKRERAEQMTVLMGRYCGHCRRTADTPPVEA